MLDFDIADESAQLPRNFYLLLGNARSGGGTGVLLLESLGGGSFIRLGISALNVRKSAIWSLDAVRRTKIRLL
jgi:hypothetical protein